MFKSPLNKVLSKFSKNFFLPGSPVLSKNFLVAGKYLLVILSILATCSIEKLVSAILRAFSCILDKNTCSGLLDLALKIAPNLSNPLAILELLYASSFPFLANVLAPVPMPYTKGVTNTDSDANLVLFISFLTASSDGSSFTSLSNCVGPASNTSPKEPISSVSPTNVSPAAPPKTNAPNLFLPVSLFNSLAFLIPFCALLLFMFAYLPVFLAFNALLASFNAILEPTAAGVPICINACVILPAALAFAVSSKMFIVSKKDSTSSAAFSVSPRSMSSAPRDTTPSTVLTIPEPTPAAADVNPPTSSSGTLVTTSTPRTFLVMVFCLSFSLSVSSVIPIPDLNAI